MAANTAIMAMTSNNSIRMNLLVAGAPPYTKCIPLLDSSGYQMMD